MSETFSYIKKIPLFSHLQEDELSSISSLAKLREFSADQLIMVEGEPDAPVFFVASGKVRTYRTNLDGREQTLTYLVPPEGFNIPTAFSSKTNSPANAQAQDDTILVVFTQANFRQIASDNSGVAFALLKTLSDKLIYLTDLVHNVSLRNVRARLARFLLNQSEQAKERSRYYTQEEIATQIGTTREIVSRTLRAFIQEDLITTQRHRIIVKNKVALRQEAE